MWQCFLGVDVTSLVDKPHSLWDINLLTVFFSVKTDKTVTPGNQQTKLCLAGRLAARAGRRIYGCRRKRSGQSWNQPVTFSRIRSFSSRIWWCCGRKGLSSCGCPQSSQTHIAPESTGLTCLVVGYCVYYKAHLLSSVKKLFLTEMVRSCKVW